MGEKWGDLFLVSVKRFAVPTVTRLITTLVLLGLLGYGAVYSLANLVTPRQHEITLRVQKDGFAR